MKILSVKAGFPSTCVSNSEVIARIREDSEGVFQGDLEGTLRAVDVYLRMAGAKTRRWLRDDREHGELIRETVGPAIEEAGIDREAEGVVIAAGVDRAFAEPGDAYFIAKAFGLKRAQCFDVADACNSFSRATLLARALLKSGAHPWVLIVNAECKTGSSLAKKGKLTLLHERELNWKFGSYTTADCVTATILAPASAEEDWKFKVESDPDAALLCAIPWESFRGFGYLLGAELEELATRNQMSASFLKDDSFKFICFSKELQALAMEATPRVLEGVGVALEDCQLILPHTTSVQTWLRGARQRGFEERLFSIFPDYGNVVSASIPAGLALAQAARRLKRGDRVMCWTAAAGMSYFAYSFVF